MMGRDDIPVGLGDVFAMNQSDPVFSAVGDCKYLKAIPHGSGGLLDSDTLYGLARDLPRSPRRYNFPPWMFMPFLSSYLNRDLALFGTQISRAYFSSQGTLQKTL